MNNKNGMFNLSLQCSDIVRDTVSSTNRSLRSLGRESDAKRGGPRAAKPTLHAIRSIEHTFFRCEKTKRGTNGKKNGRGDRHGAIIVALGGYM